MTSARNPDPNSLRHLLFAFDGRIGRAAWWRWGVAAMLGLSLYLTVALRVAGLGASNTDILVNLLLLWPALALSVKRWHDRNLSGWWVLSAAIPIVGWIWLLVANGFLRGTPGPNRWGAPPDQ